MKIIYKLNYYISYISSIGRLRVNEGAVSSPYFQYPIVPNEMKIPLTKIIPIFKTPKIFEKLCGCFIAFLSGKTKAIPSKAKIVVPKKSGSVRKSDGIKSLVDIGGKSCEE